MIIATTNMHHIHYHHFTSSFSITFVGVALAVAVMGAALVRTVHGFHNFTIEELTHTVFPKKTSNDEFYDPCKASGFMGDIALEDVDYSDAQKHLEMALLQKEIEKYKQELLEGLQIEEEGLTDFVRKKTKQSPIAQTAYSHVNYNDPASSGHSEPMPSPLMTSSTGIHSKKGQTLRTDVRSNQKKIRHESHHAKRQQLQQQPQQPFNLELPVETPVHEFEPNFDLKRKHISKRRKRAATARKERIWDYGVIPYEIDGNFSGGHKALFKQAMRHWENFTCVKFVERNRDEHDNYIIFTERPCGCCSFVGKRGNGGQAISIGKNCDKFGIVVHELGHVVGFWHEHTRPDRDKHVNIIRDNIMTGQEYNFNKLNEDEVNSLGLIYDYDSIMHYARNTFSKGTFLDTIQPIDDEKRPRPEIGQRVRLSVGDIAQTNLLYKCPTCGRTYQSNAASFSSPKFAPDASERCEWRITATHGEKIVLNITELDIEKSPDCSAHYLEIRDGYWQKSPSLGRFCGSMGPKYPIISTGPRLLLTYVVKGPKNHRGFSVNYEAICGGELVVTSEGHLESPNYPEEYQPNKECIWKISVAEQHQVALRFQSFEVENHDTCVYDYVQIRDGPTEDSPILDVFCGHKTPANIISSSNHLFVKFVSDGSVQKGGFSATILKEFDECAHIDHGCTQQCTNTLGGYECSCHLGFELHSDRKSCEKACGGLMESSNGSITSPSFPNLYPANKRCVWEIVAKPKFRITLNFTHFDVEGNNLQSGAQQSCDYDRIEVYSKGAAQGAGGTDKLKRHGVFCGAKPPPLLISDTNVLRVVFISDVSVQKTGFAAVFYADRDECADHNGNCEHMCINTLGSFICTCHNGFTLDANGRNCSEGDCKYEITAPFGTISSPNHPQPYPAGKDCVWQLITTPGHRIRISFVHFDLEPHQECFYDNVSIYDGPTPDYSLLGKFCGDKAPPMIVSSTNELYMTFRTDTSVDHKGFWATHASLCGGMLQAIPTKRYVHSHALFGKDNYDNNADCEWTIRTQRDFHVKVAFFEFDLESERDCMYDYVEILSGVDSSARTYGRYCGSTKPHDIISVTDTLLIRFKSDDTFTMKGFRLAYEAVEDSYEDK